MIQHDLAWYEKKVRHYDSAARQARAKASQKAQDKKFWTAKAEAFEALVKEHQEKADALKKTSASKRT